MKKYLLVLAALLLAPVSADATVLGITPCATQPADLSFSGVSANVQLKTCGSTVIVFNNSTSDARFKVGTASNTTAALTDALIPQKTFIVLNVPLGAYFAAISSGTGTISFVQGQAQ